jgi:hypothetical protein
LRRRRHEKVTKLAARSVEKAEIREATTRFGARKERHVDG